MRRIYTFFVRRAKRKKVAALRTFRFAYLRHPFDDPQYFSITAKYRGDAIRLAWERLGVFLEQGHTVCPYLYRA